MYRITGKDSTEHSMMQRTLKALAEDHSISEIKFSLTRRTDATNRVWTRACYVCQTKNAVVKSNVCEQVCKTETHVCRITTEHL